MKQISQGKVSRPHGINDMSTFDSTLNKSYKVFKHLFETCNM